MAVLEDALSLGSASQVQYLPTGGGIEGPEEVGGLSAGPEPVVKRKAYRGSLSVQYEESAQKGVQYEEILPYFGGSNDASESREKVTRREHVWLEPLCK